MMQKFVGVHKKRMSLSLCVKWDMFGVFEGLKAQAYSSMDRVYQWPFVSFLHSLQVCFFSSRGSRTIREKYWEYTRHDVHPPAA